MIKIREFEVKNTVNELTVEEFQKIASILNDTNLSRIFKWMDIFTYLGLPEDVLDEMGNDEFTEAVKLWNDTPRFEGDLIAKLEVDGRTYVAHEGEYSVKVRDLKHLERKVNESPTNYMAYWLAVIFKDEQLTKNEHYDSAHLRHKEKLFKEQPAAVALPYVTFIAKEISEDSE